MYELEKLNLKYISVLLTTYNRVDKTLRCLDHLFQCSLPINFELQVYIADSNSPDNTFSIISEKYPEVEIFSVGENVFWNQGMRLAWIKASQSSPDFYLWLNDDTFLFPDSIQILINDFYSIKNDSIIVGVTDFKGNLTYGGRKDSYNDFLIEPNGRVRKATFMNGNCVLISKQIFLKVGNLNSLYRHSLGDIDYGFRALKLGVDVFISSKVVANCSPNNFIWNDSNFNFLKRVRNLVSTKGLSFKEHIYFNYKFYGILKSIKFIVSVTIALFFPKTFNKVSKNETFNKLGSSLNFFTKLKL